MLVTLYSLFDYACIVCIDAAEQPKEEEAGTENIRLTRTRTGALRNKTQRLVEEMDASDDSSRDSRDSERSKLCFFMYNLKAAYILNLQNWFTKNCNLFS